MAAPPGRVRSLPASRPTASQARVSILLPVRDAATTLPACLRSILRQTERRWQCVAVDDGSRDASGEILRAAALRDDRFRILSRPARGLVASLQEGLAHCRAPVVARMDADDCMHRERLEAQLDWLERHPELSAVGCRVRIFPRASLRDGRRRYETWLNGLGDPASIRRDAFVECPVAHPTLAIRSHVLRAFGYRDLGWPEDYDLILRLLAADHLLAIHPRRLLAWRDGPGRLSRRAPEYSLERFTACRAAHLAAGPLGAGSQYVLWGHGPTGRKLRRALLLHGKRASHIIEVHPRRLGGEIHGAPVVSPDAIASLPPRPIVVAVAGAGPRAEIRKHFASIAFEEGSHFFCAA